MSADPAAPLRRRVLEASGRLGGALALLSPVLAADARVRRAVADLEDAVHGLVCALASADRDLRDERGAP
jgi:hypothetical protein